MRLGIDLGINQRFGTAAAATTAPAAFTAGQWTLADSPSAGGNTLTVNLTALPSDGGSAITALQFRRNGGAATALTGTSTGGQNITVTATTAADIQVRAVNAIGAGPWSDTKTATPTVSAFTEYEIAALRQTVSGGPTTLQTGTGITFIWDLRFSIDGNITYCLPGTGNCSALTMTPEPNGKELRISGFTNAAQRNGLLAHHGHMPNIQAPGFHEFCQIYARNPNLPNPRVGTNRPPGLEIQCTRFNQPVGVT